MKVEPFALERTQCTYANSVQYNLAGSSIFPPVAVRELVSNNFLENPLMLAELGYSQFNGTPELRRAIAKLHPGADENNVVVTNGSIQANFLLAWACVEPDDEVVFMLPSYMQLWGLACSFRANIRVFHLKEELGWQPDLEELDRAVTRKTKLIVICNPNNPTGTALSETAMAAIIQAADANGAWLFCDEVYQGAEHDGKTTESFWGRYEKTIVVNGLSKAYRLPGLRIGWIVAPKEQMSQFWVHLDYLSLAPSTLSEQLACLALDENNRNAILQRTRDILRKNYTILESWLENPGCLFDLVPPRAGPVAFLKYHVNINSTQLAEKLRNDKSVLLGPGDYFGLDGYLRIGYGRSEEYLQSGLNRIQELLSELNNRA